MTLKTAPSARPNPFTTKYVPVEELEEQHNPKPSTVVIDGMEDEETPAPVETQAPASGPAAIKLAAKLISCDVRTDTVEEPIMTREEIRRALRDAAAREQSAREANLPAALAERKMEESELARQRESIKLAALAFSRECADMVAKDYERFTSLTAQGFSRTVTIEFGRKYAKLISCDVRGGVESAQSVYCFVDMTNGDILKAATWRAPAKHARGNVLRSDRMQSVTAYGANYLR